MRIFKIVFVINCCIYLNSFSFDLCLFDVGLIVFVLKCFIFYDDISLFEVKIICEYFFIGFCLYLMLCNFKLDWLCDLFCFVLYGLMYVYYIVYCLLNKFLVLVKLKLLWILDNFLYFFVEIVFILCRYFVDGRLLFFFLC